MTQRFRQPSETGPLVTLEHGPYALTVAPGFGARMVSFRHAGRDLLRPTPDSVLAKPVVYGFAGFPLMPYSGPLFGPGSCVISSSRTSLLLWRIPKGTIQESPWVADGSSRTVRSRM